MRKHVWVVEFIRDKHHGLDRDMIAIFATKALALCHVRELHRKRFTIFGKYNCLRMPVRSQ